MKYLAPLLVAFALIEYTTPSGFAIFLNRDQIVGVTHANESLCDRGSNARIFTTKGDACVRETVDQVVQKLQAFP